MSWYQHRCLPHFRRCVAHVGGPPGASQLPQPDTDVLVCNSGGLRARLWRAAAILRIFIERSPATAT